MKSYEEMADSLFKRREEYNRARAKRMRKIRAAAAAASCFCAAVALGFGLIPNEPAQPENIINVNMGNMLAEAPKQNVSVTERIDTEAEKIDEAIRELVENCAANIVPKLPADMKSTDGYVVCRARDDAEGEAETPDSEAAAYFVTFSYTGDNNRSVRIEVCEGGDFDSIAGSEKYKKSVVKGRDVYIALTGKGEYQANFTLGDVGFRITSVGLTQEELIYVIESLAENS